MDDERVRYDGWMAQNRELAQKLAKRFGRSLSLSGPPIAT